MLKINNNMFSKVRISESINDSSPIQPLRVFSQQSPLEHPLNQALNKITKSRNNLNTNSNSNVNGSTLSSNDNSKHAHMLHQETKRFLNKYFPKFEDYDIEIEHFVAEILREYEGLWTEEQGKSNHTHHKLAYLLNPCYQGVETEFVRKMHLLVGKKGMLNIQKLLVLTKENGMIGLILQIFKLLKEDQQSVMPVGSVCTLQSSSTSNFLSSETLGDLQNIKNILQEFLESMFKQFQNQIYARLNVQMKRIVLKYKETDKLMKLLQENINENVDLIHSQKRIKEMKAAYEHQILQINQELTTSQAALDKQNTINEILRNDIEKLTKENQRLNQKVEEFHTVLLNGYANGSVAPKLPPQREKHSMADVSSGTAYASPISLWNINTNLANNPLIPKMDRSGSTTPNRTRGLSFVVDENKHINFLPNKENLDTSNRAVKML